MILLFEKVLEFQNRLIFIVKPAFKINNDWKKYT